MVELNGQMLDAFNSIEAARVFIQAEAARTGSNQARLPCRNRLIPMCR